VVCCRSAPPYAGRARAPGDPPPIVAWTRAAPTAGAPGRGGPCGADGLAVAVAWPAEAWTRQTIKEGSPGPMVAEFAARRVMAVRDVLPGPDVWLVRRRHVETGELKTSLCNAPVDTAVVARVRMSGMRWPIATCVEDGKHLLGMGDYDVRSWTGWQHHLPLVILVHFFVGRMSLRLKKSPRSDMAPEHDGVGDGLAPTRV
jgi:hypothetical protein